MLRVWVMICSTSSNNNVKLVVFPWISISSSSMYSSSNSKRYTTSSESTFRLIYCLSLSSNFNLSFRCEWFDATWWATIGSETFGWVTEDGDDVGMCNVWSEVAHEDAILPTPNTRLVTGMSRGRL